jgi:hypothetical protein
MGSRAVLEQGQGRENALGTAREKTVLFCLKNGVFEAKKGDFWLKMGQK